MSANTDVAIIGGGIMGSALAYWLTRLDPALSVTVIERDPTYATASSTLSAASIRQQFSTPVNIRISQASFAFLRDIGDHLRLADERPEIALVERGYLYLAAPGQELLLRQAHAIQRDNNADVVLLDRQALQSALPWLNVDGLSLGSLGQSGEGWFDGDALLTAFARKARAQGAKYVTAEVTGLELENGRIARATLRDGSHLSCGTLVNAAGPWAQRVAAWAGLDLPVRARRRTVFVIACKARLDRMPLLIDPSGFWIRPEGQHFIAGIAPPVDPDDAPLEPEYDLFEPVLWPALAARISAFEDAKLVRAWAGYYEMNVFDHNAVIGPHPAVENLYFINGFSGHGMQQAPIATRALAELMLSGKFQSLDLSELSFQRIVEGRPFRELGVIG
jgi:FAD-dependent oxidoreductase domain-containing protein 1